MTDAFTGPLDDHASRAEKRPSMAELVRATYSLTADGGSWERLATSKNHLVGLLKPCFGSYPTQSHRDNVSPEEAREMLIGNGGLASEFDNGPEASMQKYLLGDPGRTGGISRQIKLALEGFNEHSDLSARPLGEKLGLTTEIRSEALMRISQDIEAWVAANQTVLPQDTQDAIRTELGHYNQALGEVLDYVQIANNYSLNSVITQI